MGPTAVNMSECKEKKFIFHLRAVLIRIEERKKLNFFFFFKYNVLHVNYRHTHDVFGNFGKKAEIK